MCRGGAMKKEYTGPLQKSPERQENGYSTISVKPYKAFGERNILADLRTAEYEYCVDVICKSVYGSEDSPQVIQPHKFCDMPDQRYVDPNELADTGLETWDGVS